MKDTEFLKSNGVNLDSALELLGDLSFYDETLEQFIEENKTRLPNIVKYRKEGNMPEYAILVHALKSDSKYLGFTDLAEIALEHEMASKANDIDTVNAKFNDLVNTYNKYAKIAFEYLGTPTIREETSKEEVSSNETTNADRSDYFTYKQGDIQFGDSQCEFCKLNNPDNPNVCSKYPNGKPEEITKNIKKCEFTVIDSPLDDMIDNEKTNENVSAVSKKIIVADDSSIISNIVEKAFEGMYEVLVAPNGGVAIDYIKNNNADDIVALILDLNMPEVDGFAVLDYFKENNLFVNIPVCIITGDVEKERIDRAFTYDIVDVLPKPFTMDSVRNVINKILSNKQ